MRYESEREGAGDEEHVGKSLGESQKECRVERMERVQGEACRGGRESIC